MKIWGMQPLTVMVPMQPMLAARCLLGWLWSCRALLLPAAEQGAGPDLLGMMLAALGGQGLLFTVCGVGW